MTEPTTPDLKARLAKAQEKRRVSEDLSEAAKDRYSSISNAGRGMTFVAEFISPMVVGLAIGGLLDWWFKTSPLFLLLLFCFGLAAGVMGVIRAYRNLNAELEAQALAKADEDKTNGTDNP